MAEIKTHETDNREVTVKMSTLTEGIGIVFSGVLTILEALDASTAKGLVEGFVNENGETDSGERIAVPDNTAGDAVADSAGKKVPASVAPQLEQPAQPESGLTVDDVARIVVQKVKANPGINEKIRALVIAHGAQRVTELKPEVLEAFLTDLCQL